jgi:hypothetical protein
MTIFAKITRFSRKIVCETTSPFRYDEDEVPIGKFCEEVSSFVHERSGNGKTECHRFFHRSAALGYDRGA